jgi:hypothetical protein
MLDTTVPIPENTRTPEAQLFSETVRSHVQKLSTTSQTVDTPALPAKRVRLVPNIDTMYTSIFDDMDSMQDTAAIVLPLEPTTDSDLWPQAQRLADAIGCHLQKHQNGNLRKITVVTLSITFADILSTVLNTLASAATTTDTLSPSPDDQSLPMATPDVVVDSPDATSATNDDWAPIERILAQRKGKGGNWYKVKWLDSSAVPSWVPRRDVTTEAIQRFYADRPPRRRRH